MSWRNTWPQAQARALPSTCTLMWSCPGPCVEAGILVNKTRMFPCRSPGVSEESELLAAFSGRFLFVPTCCLQHIAGTSLGWWVESCWVAIFYWWMGVVVGGAPCGFMGCGMGSTIAHCEGCGVLQDRIFSNWRQCCSNRASKKELPRQCSCRTMHFSNSGVHGPMASVP